MNDDTAIFIQAVQADGSLPAVVREQAAAVRNLECRALSPSCLDFLREQIALEPRGPEWTAVLAARLAALSPFCGVTVLFGCIPVPDGFCFVRVDPARQIVIYHEAHESTESA